MGQLRDEDNQPEAWAERDEDQDIFEREQYEERIYADFTSDRYNNYDR